MLCHVFGVRAARQERPAATLHLVLALLTAWGVLTPVRGEDRDGKLKIAIVGTQFNDVPAPLIQLSIQPFQALIQSETKVPGEFEVVENANELAEQLAASSVQFGVFHGVEFAWARAKHPDLKPLAIAVNQHRQLRAHLMVAKESTAAQFVDLRGKSLAVAKGTRLHCRLFVAKPCREMGHEPKDFFSEIVRPANTEDALDDVVDGEAQAAVVDGVALDCYKRRKPGRFVQLRELSQSELFPCSVVAYHAGRVDDTTLKRFRDGLIRVNQRPGSKPVLMLWKMTGFEPIPADYEQMVTDIAKAYPAAWHQK